MRISGSRDDDIIFVVFPIRRKVVNRDVNEDFVRFVLKTFGYTFTKLDFEINNEIVKFSCCSLQDSIFF